MFKIKQASKERGVVVHAFKSSTQEAEASESLEYKASLDYRLSSRPVNDSNTLPQNIPFHGLTLTPITLAPQLNVVVENVEHTQL